MAVEILVTGAAGSLGRQVVQTLRTAGHQVLASGRVPGEDVDSVWDVSRDDAPSPDCNPTVVVHAAAKMGRYQQPLSEAGPVFDANVGGSLRLADWCARRQVKRLVLISGAIVYGEWTESAKSEADPVKPWAAGPYAVSKYCGEQAALMVLTEGIELSILRLSSLYGFGYRTGLAQRLLQTGQKTGEILLKPPFDDAFDLLHVSDAARTVQRVIELEASGTWNVGAGTLTTIKTLAEACASQVNAQLTLSDGDGNRPPRILNWVDDSKARIDLGHTNSVSLDAGIAQIDSSSRSASQPV